MTSPGTSRPLSGARTSQAGLLVVLPVLAIVLNLFVWLTAVSRSGFWADDFLNLTHFSRSLGHLSDDHINTGKYVINVFWAVGTEAFGNGSVVPFLLLNSLVFGSGVFLWLWVGRLGHWSGVVAWWIAALFLATGAWLPTALWSSNITHSGGFFALGAALLAHERAMSAPTARSTLRWSVAGGAAWTAAVISNLLYIGLLPIAAYCAWRQIRKLDSERVNATWVRMGVACWLLLVPVLYFLVVAYPATKSSSAYASTGLGFFRENFDFYRSVLAQTTLMLGLYIAVIIAAIAGAAAGTRRRDWFPIAVLAAAAATAAPAFIQGQQRDVHYLAMPLLLLFSAAGAGARHLLTERSPHPLAIRTGLVVATIATLGLVFTQAGDVRNGFVTTPYGHQLTAFREQVALLTPADGTICAKLALDPPNQALFNAEMSGEDGFLVPPIAAAQAYLLAPSQPCPTAAAAHITVSLDHRGEFVARG